MHTLILPFLDNMKDICFVCGVYNNDVSLSDVLERLSELARALKKGTKTLKYVIVQRNVPRSSCRD
jgi:hypothetical protein